MAVIIPAIVGLAYSGYQVYQGEKSKKEANEAAGKLKRPVYDSELSKSEYDALNLLKSRAGQGLSSSARNLYQQNADRGLTSTLDAIIKSGGDPNSVSKAYSGYADNIGRLALADDAAKINNINAFLNQQRRVSDQEMNAYDTGFKINQYAPYADEAARIAQLRGQGRQMTNAGITTLGQTALGYGQAIGQRQDTASVNGGKVNLFGRTITPANKTTIPLSNNQQNLTNNWGTYIPPNNDVGSWGTGIDWSSLSPSQRQEVLGLIGDQSNQYI